MPDGKAPNRARRRAILVGASPDQRAVALEALAAEGFAVVPADTGKQALRLLADVQPHVLLADIDAPELNGLETCTALRSIPGYEETPFLMFVHAGDSRSGERALAAGATDFVDKPLSSRLLRHRVRQVAGSGTTEKPGVDSILSALPDVLLTLDRDGQVSPIAAPEHDA